jgi:hypothetical protein
MTPVVHDVVCRDRQWTRALQLIDRGFSAQNALVVSASALRHKGVMWITTEEAVTMYARFCRARFGVRAKDMVLAKADKLEAAGDLEGKRIWSDVARVLDTLHDAGNEKPAPRRRTKSFN